jgi:hypothetical protein
MVDWATCWRTRLCNVFYLHFILGTPQQRKTAVKVHRVFASHRESPAYAPVRRVHRVTAWDSGNLVALLMRASN